MYRFQPRHERPRIQVIIAGAGTGKTTTIVGKIKYLALSGKCKPEDILVLSFTNASASEMSTRINKDMGNKIEASTFHKFGLNILKEADGIIPKITNIDMKKFVKEQLNELMKDKVYLSMLSIYLLFNRVRAKSEFDFESQSEYEDYLRLNPPVTISNESVKSYGEMDIANYLTLCGIEYIYEQEYKVNTRTSEYGIYKPDFYLPEYDLYIEYFGINRNGEVPKYFSSSHGVSATKSYQSSMNWKRELHKENNTVLIECFAYEKFEGNLTNNLRKKLEDRSVKIIEKSADELWNELSDNNNTILNGVIEFFETLINLIKSNDYSIDELKVLCEHNENKAGNLSIVKLVEPIFNAYRNALESNDAIDFNDMINTARKYIDEGKYKNPYKYVIVDEYQDISKARFRLLYSLRKTMDYKLFCVGDDWQSIYRFAGSDIGYIVNFQKYWGYTEISKIETTYRFSQDLIEVSSNFIMQNPMQLRKNIRGNRRNYIFPVKVISGYNDKYAIEFMTKSLDNLQKNSTVFFLGRYSFDKDILDECSYLQCKYNNLTGYIDVVYSKRTDLNMQFITAHRSKGLQADYIYIINNKDSKMGFPSKIQDAPILDLLLDNCDTYPFAEERRLFYVALTRAKKEVTLVTVEGSESVFYKEIFSLYADEIKKAKYTCPKCGGRLVKRSSQYGEFLGCSNYKTLGCKFTINILKK